MLDHNSQTITVKDKILILFKEYDTLRAEILGRSASHHQLIYITAALAAAVVAITPANRARGYILATAVVVCAAVFFLYARANTNALASRVREIEDLINRLSGEPLLRWETERGALALGWVARAWNSGRRITSSS
jgi:hypothetical protein